MSTTTATPALGQEVLLREVESGLRRFWSSNDTSQKASLINLALWSEADDALDRLPAVIESVSLEHACRAILIAADIRPDLEPETRAWITAHCHLGSHGKAACSEQIALSFRGRVTGRIRNAVLAHLISDLPFVLYCEGELSDFLEANLLRSLERLVVDSAAWADPDTSWKHLAELTEGLGSLVLHDLAWTRAFVPRTIFAARFEDERLRRQLDQAQQLTIHYGPGQRATALSFVGWIATALSAELEEADDHRLRFRAEGSLEVDLIEAGDGPSLQQLHWSSGPCQVAIVRDDGRWSTVTRHGDHESAAQLVPADAEDLASLLDSQLARGGRNTLFERCLPMFTQLR